MRASRLPQPPKALPSQAHSQAAAHQLARRGPQPQPGRLLCRYTQRLERVDMADEEPAPQAQPGGAEAKASLTHGTSKLQGDTKASDLFVRALEAEGVRWIFGVPGEENLDFVESLRGSSIELVVTRHEQAAGFMAATVGRLTGKAGVALSTLGPGATNFVTAAAFANLGAFPLLLITGQKPVLKSKQGAFQIVDMVEIFRPVTKLAYQLVHGGLVPSKVREAVRRAEEERPGCTHLELPEDVAHQQVPEEECMLFTPSRVRRPVPEGKAIAAAAQLIKEAQHPLLIVGAGANRKVTCKMLRQFVEATGMPFCDTMMGKGVIDSRHERYMGTAAISSADFVHHAIAHADLIIMVGHDVVEKPPFLMRPGDRRRVIHINYITAQVDQVYFPHLEVVGDISNAIWQLKDALAGWEPTWNLSYFKYVREEMLKQLDWGVSCCDFPTTPPRFVHLVREALPEDGIICLDNGLYKVWFARQYPTYQPNTLLLDNALATMGAGLPSAIAAKMVHPEQQVVAITGDGGLMMCSHELLTAVRLGLHLTVLVMNDNCYGMIKWKQENMQFADFGLALSNPDFVKFAESFGAQGHRVAASDELVPTLRRCLDTPAVHLVELPVDYAVSEKIQVSYLKKYLGEHLKSPSAFFSSQGSSSSSSGRQSAAAARGQGDSEGPPEEEVKAAKAYPFYLGNKAQQPNTDLLVNDKYTQKIAYKVALASPEDIDKAIDLAQKALRPMARLASYQRKEILEHCVRHFQERFEELAMALCIEAGKPIKDARGEVTRLIDTFQIAVEESVRQYGEYAPMDSVPRTKGYHAITKRFPIGIISMVSPFNFPLNLTAHKIAPALAVGCPFVLKPASRTPIGALIIGEILSTAPHLPEGAFSILPCSRDGADLFTKDERFRLLTFTGSGNVGWKMKADAGKKPVILELGGNAAAIVEDYRDGEDLKSVVSKIIYGAYYQSGQSCIGVQRLLIREDHYAEVVEALVKAVGDLKSGDPKDEEVFVGPMISVSEAERIEGWVQEAVDGGAKVLAGHRREGPVYEATVVEGVPPGLPLDTEEAFAPVMSVAPYKSFEDAIAMVNDSKFGLQTGVFTHDLDKAWHAFEELDVGGVVVNHVPSVRVDSQAYGGNKESGLGREGVRYAMEHMTELRVLLLATPGQTL